MYLHIFVCLFTCLCVEHAYVSLWLRMLCIWYRASSQKLNIMAPILLTGLNKVIDQPVEVFDVCGCGE